MKEKNLELNQKAKLKNVFAIIQQIQKHIELQYKKNTTSTLKQEQNRVIQNEN